MDIPSHSSHPPHSLSQADLNAAKERAEALEAELNSSTGHMSQLRMKDSMERMEKEHQEMQNVSGGMQCAQHEESDCETPAFASIVHVCVCVCLCVCVCVFAALACPHIFPSPLLSSSLVSPPPQEYGKVVFECAKAKAELNIADGKLLKVWGDV